jgi:uncharacterized membrane protein YeaQ/YmgE (transglycosylase-associated protein family)
VDRSFHDVNRSRVAISPRAYTGSFRDRARSVSVVRFGPGVASALIGARARRFSAAARRGGALAAFFLGVTRSCGACSVQLRAGVDPVRFAFWSAFVAVFGCVLFVLWSIALC